MGDARPFYFQEEIRITDPFNTIRYMRDVVEYQTQPDLDDPQAHPEGKPIRPKGIELIGTWYLLGTTGTWPRVINLWECAGGWTGVWRNLLGMYDGMPEGLFWKMSNETREGGYTDVYAAVEGCPDLAGLQARGVRGQMFVHEQLRVAPGTGAELLERARRSYVPAMEDHGLALVGLYEGLLTDDRVLMVFAGSTSAVVEAGAAEEAARGYGPAELADARLTDWRAESRPFLPDGWRRQMLSPCPGSPLGAF